MDIKSVQKVSYIANSVLFSYVIGVFWIYNYYQIDVMRYISFAAFMVYIVGYFILNKGWLDIYIWIIYAWISFYMCVATISLGYDYGFFLYTMSLIPIIFVSKYIAYAIGNKSPHPVFISIMIALASIICALYTVVFEPIYVINKNLAGVFMVINAVSVFGFIITYSRMMVEMVIDSQEKLKKMAHLDRLTSLYNRHFMIDYLEKNESEFGSKNSVNASAWIAMIDIDDFKHINDTYGHNCGDAVLVHLAEMIKTGCAGCTVSRWGGEEFLVVSDGSIDASIMDTLNSNIFNERFTYNNEEIRLSITVGIALYDKSNSLDGWIQEADKKLYYGKNNGKNMVVK